MGRSLRSQMKMAATSWVGWRILKRRAPDAARIVELGRGKPVNELQPLLRRELEQRGLGPVTESVHHAIQFFRVSESGRDHLNLYTAMTRALSFEDTDAAIRFGERYLDSLGDRRAIRSLAVFYQRQRKPRRALALLHKLDADDWRAATEERLLRMCKEVDLEVKVADELNAAIAAGEKHVREMAEKMAAMTDERVIALGVLFSFLRAEFRATKRLASCVIAYGEELAGLSPKVFLNAAQICDAYLHQGSITKALAALDAYAPEDEQTDAKRKRVQAFKKLLDSGFRYQPESSSYMLAPNRVLYPLHNSLPYDSGGYAARTHGLLSGVFRHGWNISGVSRLGYPQDRAKHKHERYQSVSRVDQVLYFRLRKEGHAYGEVPIYDYLCSYTDTLYELAKRERPEIIHAPSNYMNGVAANAVARAMGIKSIYEVRGLWEVTRISRQPDWEGTEYFNMMQSMELQAALDADAVICITEALKEEMIRRGVPGDKIRVVPNGVDVDRFVPRAPNQELKARLGLGGKKIIGYIGSVVDYEGLDYLMRAASQLDKKGVADFAVLIVGDGAVLEDVKELARELGILDGLVTFTGRVPHEEVEDYYSIIDIAPFPRKSLPVTEMVSPLKPFEAMAMEKIVLASNVAALAEIVQDGVNGFLFQKDDVDDLTAKLEMLLGDGAGQGLGPRQWVIENRSWHEITKKLDELYKELTTPAQPVKMVALDDIPLAEDVERVLSEFRKVYETKSPAHLRRDDYARWSHVSKLVKHETSLLDVGVGLGQFVNAMASRKKFERIVGVDISRHSLFLEVFEGFTMDYSSIESLPYGDDEIDVVTCMETIEHIPDAIFEKGVAELRRVCKKQLIVTVPFREETLSKGHVRRFDFADLERLFPRGEITILRKATKARGTYTHWALIEETNPRA